MKGCPREQATFGQVIINLIGEEIQGLCIKRLPILN